MPTTDTVASANETELRSIASSRLMSLDLFRGLTIAGMILVNNPGNSSAYTPLEHAAWNGWTPTDLVFPFFLFIVGVSMVLSFESRLRRGATRASLLIHTLRRSLIIFAIGVGLNAFPFHHVMPIRLPGVLQRIAIAYAIAAIIVLWTGTRGRAIAAFVLIAGYWALMRFVPVPGLGVPGRDIPFLDPDRNLAAWLDRLVVPGHLYEKTRDPEGLLSTLPSIATALLGVLTGAWLSSSRSVQKKAAGMFGVGLAGLAMGKLMDIYLMPINKNLWTSSFVVFMAGFALVVLAVCYWLVDIKHWRRLWATPFVALGMNAIAIYTVAMLIAKTFNRLRLPWHGHRMNIHDYINARYFAPLASPSMASLLYSLSFIVVCMLIAYLMYRRRIFLKV